MRIVFYIWSLGIGGAERHTLDLAGRLRREGFDAVVMVHSGSCHPDLRPDPLLPIIKLNSPGFTNPFGWLKAWRALADLDADVLISVNQSATLVALAGRWIIRRPLVFIFHSTILARRVDRLKMQVLKATASSFLTVFCSVKQQEYWKSHGFNGPSIAIPNGIDASLFSPPTYSARIEAKKRLGLDESEFVVGMIAAFRPEKNHFGLVRAIDLLRSQGVAATVLFVGDGPLRGDVEAMVAKVHLEDKVIFVGQKADVRPFLSAIDVGVICSTSVETFSLAALETMATETPMIMTDIGGASEMVAHEVSGIIVPPGDVGSLVAALHLMNDAGLRKTLAHEARRSIERHFTVEAMVARYAELLRAIMIQPLARTDAAVAKRVSEQLSPTPKGRDEQSPRTVYFSD